MTSTSRLAIVIAMALVTLAVALPATSRTGEAAPAAPVEVARPPGHLDPIDLAVAMRAGGCSAVSGAGTSGAVVAVPAQDSCMECHISGEIKTLTTPLARWVLFGGAALAFMFGVVRSATVWRSRAPWQPLTRRAVGWVDSRYEVVQPLSEALSKPVPKFARRWAYCLGGMTFFVFAIQAVTGIMLAFYYQPTAAAAHSSIEYIMNSVRFGAEVRTIHAWTANAMVILCVAHMLRTFIVGAYKRPRELNWVSGGLLFVLTMGFGFTGYLLPWDQRAFWASTIGSDIAGGLPVVGNLALLFMRVGWSVAEATLQRFYALHIIVMPIATLAAMGAHFFMVRRLGIHRPL